MTFSEPDNRELILKSIYQGDFPEDRIWMDNALYYGDKLWDALRSSVKKNQLANNKPPSNLNEWLNRQHHNLYKFSAAKSYAELLEYKNAIIDPQTGRIKSYEDFKKHCDDIGKKYKDNWLNAEYDAVVNGTIQGTNWLEYQQNKDLFPYLQYKIIDDNRTRDSHRRLRDIIEHIDSPFWIQYMPQNAWRCRCWVKQLSERMAEHFGYVENTAANMKKAGDVVDKYWRRNTGMSELFPEEGTMYYQAMPGKGKNQLNAVKNYGLKKAEAMLNQTDLPKAIKGNAEDFDAIWDSMADEDGIIRINSKIGFDYEFGKEFKAKMKSKHSEEMPNLFEVLNIPDEVWEGMKEGKRFKNEWFRKYIKYYEGGAYVVLIDSKGNPNSMYKIDASSKVEDMRRGILVNKK